MQFNSAVWNCGRVPLPGTHLSIHEEVGNYKPRHVLGKDSVVTFNAEQGRVPEVYADVCVRACVFISVPNNSFRIIHLRATFLIDHSVHTSSGPTHTIWNYKD